MTLRLAGMLAAFLAGLSGAADAKPDRPLVVVPGILGSQLCDAAGNVVWGDAQSLFRFHELKLPLGATSPRTAHKPCGLIEQVQILGPFKVHQYDTLKAFLESRDYVLGQSLYLFPYDWRLSNFHTAREFAAYVEKTFPDRTKKIDIVAHSMGGLVTRIYLETLGGAERVQNVILLGTPHRGSADVFKTLDQGWGFWKNLAAGGLTAIRETMLTFPSVYQLLPSYQNCCAWRQRGRKDHTFTSTDLRAWRRFAWLPDELKREPGAAALESMLKEAEALHAVMKNQRPAVRTANVVTGLLPTPWKTFFTLGTGEFADITPYPGDGTVMEWSAANGLPSEARASTAEHATIFEGESARTTLRWLLGTDAEPRSGLPVDFRADLEDNARRKHKLIKLSYGVEPQVAKGGEPVEFSLELTGELSLATADLSNLRLSWRAAADGLAPALADGAVSLQGQTSERRLRAGFPMPAAPGTHVLELQVPGVGSFTEVLFAIR